MTTPTMHWAHPLIGTPWTPERNCWWLVCRYFAGRHGVQMPALAIGGDPGEDNVAAILRAAQASGWRPARGAAREDDVVLMRGPLGRRHVGVMVEADGLVGVLHSDGSMTPHGPRGQVVFQSLAQATADGYGEHEFWRRAAS